mmetsp:Transcript_32442/g.85410  ORF Transcript_32442/g.85410 Transcript_32442/m.85410 type:complete len:162 (-) Transcript_32442:27-512(-)
MEGLSRLTSLTELNLDSRDITDHSIAHLAPLVKLRVLDLFSAYRLTDLSALVISGLPELAKIELCGGRITGRALEYLRPLEKLRSLSVAQNINIGDIGLRALSPQLTDLNLSECRISDAGLDDLDHMVNLRSLTLINCPRVTRGGVEQVKQDLPALRVVRV